MNIQEVRQKYPQYNDLSDEELASSFHRKFYSDMPYSDFAQKIGVRPQVSEGPLDANDARALRPPQPKPFDYSKIGYVDPPWKQALNYAIGAGKGLVGTSQLIGRALSPIEGKLAEALGYTGPIPQDQEWLLEQIKRSDQILNPDGGLNVPSLAGEAMNPLSLKAAKLVGPATTWAQRIGKGAVFGGTQAATQPVMEGDFLPQKATQVGVGTTLGALIPGGIDASKWIGRNVRELTGYVFGTTATAERLAKKYAPTIVGEKQLAMIVADIEEQLAKGGGESKLVPGYRPTVAEMAAHIPEASPLLALQKGTGKLEGGVSGQFGRRTLEQQQALENALRPIAGTPAQLSSAEGLRSATGNKLYEAAKQVPVKPDAELRAIYDNPYFRDAWERAKPMAVAQGTGDLTSLLHNTKLVLDQKLLGTGESALNRGERKIVSDLQKQVVEWLKKNNPAYETARSEFKRQSIPINQMQVGQALEQKLFGAPADQMNPGAYLRMIEDEPKAVKNILGQPRSDFGQVFDPRQQATVEEIGGLLDRKLKSTKPLQETIIRGQNIADEATARLPSVMYRPVVFANWLLKTVTSRTSTIERKVDAINAQWQLHPEQFVAALKTMPPSEAQKVMQMLQKSGVSPMNQGLLGPSISVTQQGLLGQQE